ncbi:MAG: clostripain-related cysteine peptidase [Thermoplasmata archaeon]|nr:clostripain-related cysteine peptidase [Thermoplasmata archaeon]
MCLLLSMAFVCSAVSLTTAQGDDHDCEWLFLVYLDADNNLDQYTEADLEELMEVGSTGDIEVYVLVDRLEDVAHLYYITFEDMDVVEEFPLEGLEVNMGAEATLSTFFSFTKTAANPKHIALFFWDHGSGTSGVGVDDTPYVGATESDWLTHLEVMSALAGQKVDVMGCDECLVGQIETLYEYRVIGKGVHDLDISFIVASENFIGWRGFTYDDILEQMTDCIDKTGTVCPRKVAEICVETFEDMLSIAPYKSEIVTTYSAIDMDYIVPTLDAFNILVADLTVGMDMYKPLVRAAYSHSKNPWGSVCYDVIDFPCFVTWIYENAPDEALKAHAYAVLELLPDLIFAVGGSPNMDNYGYNGMGIMFPTSWNQLTTSNTAMFEKYQKFVFPSLGWVDMLKAFFGVE